MSLLNDALRNLERREVHTRPPTAAIPAGLRQGNPKNRRPILAIAGIILVTLAVGVYVSQAWLTPGDLSKPARFGGPVGFEEHSVAAPATVAEREPVMAVSRAARPVTAEGSIFEKNVPTEAAALAPAPEIVTGSRASEQEENAAPAIPEAPQREVANKPVAPKAEAIKPSSEAMEFVVAAEPAPGSPVLPPQGVSSSSPVEPDSVKQLPQSAAARDKRLVPMLDRMLVEGREMEASQALESAVAEGLPMPRSHAAMARYYLAQDRLQEARQWLPQPLVESGMELRLLQGRLILAEDGAQAALRYLSAAPSNAAQAPEYGATLASLYQQVGQYSAAGEQWLALIETDSRRAGWWLGLALALDAQDQLEGARMAYTEALALPDLSPRLRSFAQSRLDGVR